jgi:ribonuclease-3
VSDDKTKLETILDYEFRDPALYERALTHPSFAYETSKAARDNQRMEFLGDAVLGLAIARRLFGDYGDLSEGRLSRMKAALVCEDTLAVVAEKIGLGDDIRLGRGEQASGGRSKPSILSDALEAVFAAVYLDAGYRTAEALINRLFDDLIHSARDGSLVIDHKTALQEYAQAGGDARPKYEVLESTGPAHDRMFTIRVSLNGETLGEGSGRSKKEAQKRAAKAALEAIRGRPS